MRRTTSVTPTLATASTGTTASTFASITTAPGAASQECALVGSAYSTSSSSTVSPADTTILVGDPG